ncbi:MAG: choice-of-anchor B family protein [bacterium]
MLRLRLPEHFFFIRIILLMAIFILGSIPYSFSQEFIFTAAHPDGKGAANVTIEIVNPAETTGNAYSVTFSKNNDQLSYSVENTTLQLLAVRQLPFGATSAVFDGIRVTVKESEPFIDEIIEASYGGAPVEPPVHVFRPGDLQGRGEPNSTNEFTIVGGGGSGQYSRISRFADEAAPYDYELRFDGDPNNKNVFVHAFTGQGTFKNVPFSVWNTGIGTPDDPGDDYQMIAVGFDDSNNPAVYDGGASPSDGGPGTMFDRIYFWDFNKNVTPETDRNNDGRVDYDDFLFDINNSSSDISSDLNNRAYFRSETISRISLVSLNGNPNYRPPAGTTIRFTTSKPPTEEDLYSFTTPQFGLHATSTQIDFGVANIGGTIALPVQFNNNHTGAITVNNITASQTALSFSETAFAIAAGASKTVNVQFSPQQAGEFDATITVSSDDPYFPSYSIPVSAKIFSQSGGALKVLGQHDVHPSVTADIWGYQEQDSGREYAIVGYGYFVNPPNAGVMIFDVTDPAHPQKVSEINDMPGFDVKTWRHYVYGVNGTSNGLFGRIADIADVENPQIIGSFPTAHNIFITESGYLILAIPGISVYDLNPNPASPTLVWSDNQGNGHDAHVIGDTLYDFHGSNGTFIYDFSNPTSPQLLGAITDPAIQYHHSGWPSKDGKYLFICDELAQDPSPDVTVWDISDAGNPRRAAEFADPTATVHNLQIIGDYAFLSYYTAGFRILDVSDPENPQEAERFDTSFSSGEGFDGAFGVYAFAPSRNIYISDGQNGLFVFSFEKLGTGVGGSNSELPTHYAIFDNYPNPFNPRTTITYQLPEQSNVTLTIFNILGQPVRTLVNTEQKAGSYSITWDGLNEVQQQVSSGIYLYQIEADEFIETKRMLLVR